MAREAVSVTLDADNLLWLRAQARAGRGPNVSQILDRLVGDARASGRSLAAPSRSVVGSVDLRAFDPEAANRDVRAMFARTSGAGAVRERRASSGRRRGKSRG